MKEVLEKLVNELPTIAVGVWAILYSLGIEVAPEDQAAWVSGLTSIGGFAIWLLVRKNTDGPVTTLKNKKDAQ